MTDLQRNALFSLIGVPKRYEARNITIHKFVPGDGFVTVFTSGGNMNFNDEEIDGFLDNLGVPLSLSELAIANAPADGDAAAVVPANASAAVPGYSPTAENVELKGMLMGALRAVQGDAGAIPQAKTIFDGARTMVEIQKSEFQMMQFARKNNK